MASPESLAVSAAAKQIYENRLRARLEAEHLHAIVAIEPVSGNYYLGDTLSSAIQAARAAHPDRLSFAMRVGHSAAVHLGELAL